MFLEVCGYLLLRYFGFLGLVGFEFSGLGSVVNLGFLRGVLFMLSNGWGFMRILSF